MGKQAEKSRTVRAGNRASETSKNKKGNNFMIAILNEQDKFYTYPEVAKLLRCSEKTVYNRVRNGEIHPIYNGRLVLFSMGSIEEFLQRCKTPTTQPLNTDAN